MKSAMDIASCPVVLDPVGAGATSWRTEVAAALVKQKPTLIRANASEILALDGASGSTRGVDATDAVDAAEDAAKRLADITGGVVAVTGEIDLVTDASRVVRVHGGDALMERVTAVGCALSATCAAFLAVSDDAFDGSVAALATFKRAGALAARDARGPASFRTAFVDALHNLSPGDLDEVRLT